ncbi:hypothetical protein [Bifidobacterium asteroides]|uniref:hypothetical protein n=1 Tax=Bifidobacterium asteroides TaxID=1684 RepID=UPI0015E8E78E|nr:hypothetical protein [Bifidobacterium asteroides]
MHQGTRLRRASATTILLLGLLAGLGAATADADAPPSIEGGPPDPPHSWTNPRHPHRQRSQHPTALALTNTNHHTIKHHARHPVTSHPVIDDGNT